MNDPDPARDPGSRVFRYAVLTLLAWLALGASPVPDKSRPLPAGVDVALPADVVFDRVVGPDSAVVFSHMTHARLEGYRCSTCHPKLFRILSPTRHVSHLVMDAGGSCGACHDGKAAFDVRAKQSCVSCHTGRRHASNAAAPAAASRGAPVFRGPQPIAIRTGPASPGLVTFRHSTHVSADVSCSRCHPQPYAMHGDPGDSEAAQHGHVSCGGCHDGQTAFDLHADASCSRCHVEGRSAR